MKLPDLPPPTLRLRLDAEALAANWRALDRLSGAATAGAAVRRTPTGLGVDNVVPVLRKAGARDFFVAHWSEVPAVLRHAEPGSVAVLHGPLRGEDVQFARATGVTPVINSLHQARLWLDAGGGPCHLMVDSRHQPPRAAAGRSRRSAGGLARDRYADVALRSADEDVPQNAAQLASFEQITLTARRRSLANSAGIGLGADYAFDLTRPGLALLRRRAAAGAGGRDSPGRAAAGSGAAIARALARRQRRLQRQVHRRPADARRDRVARLCRRLPALLVGKRCACAGRSVLPCSAGCRWTW
jgi:alanine racemase